MANHHPQPSPPGGGLHLHHGPQGGHPQVNGHMPIQAHHKITPAHLASLNESVWILIGINYSTLYMVQFIVDHEPCRQRDGADG